MYVYSFLQERDYYIIYIFIKKTVYNSNKYKCHYGCYYLFNVCLILCKCFIGNVLSLDSLELALLKDKVINIHSCIKKQMYYYCIKLINKKSRNKIFGFLSSNLLNLRVYQSFIIKGNRVKFLCREPSILCCLTVTIFTILELL